MDDQARVLEIVAHFNLDAALVGKLLCVLHKVDQNLFESPFITQKKLRKGFHMRIFSRVYQKDVFILPCYQIFRHLKRAIECLF